MDYEANPDGGMREKGTADAIPQQPVTEQPKVESKSETTVVAEKTRSEDTVSEKSGTEAEGGSDEAEQGSEDADDSEKSED